MAEQITGDLCHVYDAEGARRFIDTFRTMEAGEVKFGLCMARGSTFVLVEMEGVAFVFAPDGARLMADAFLSTTERFPDFIEVDAFHKMVMSLRAIADKADQRAAEA